MVLGLGRFLKAFSDGGEWSRQSSVIWTLKGFGGGGGRGVGVSSPMALRTYL